MTTARNKPSKKPVFPLLYNIWKGVGLTKEVWDRLGFIGLLLALTGVTISFRQLLSEVRQHIGVLLLGTGFGIALAVIVFWSSYDRSKNNNRKQKQELVDKLAQRRFRKYSQSVVFGAKGEVIQWRFELELEYTADEGELEAIPHVVWYDKENTAIDITPINTAGRTKRIDIEDVFMGHDKRYSFMVKFSPALQPHERRTYTYQAVPRKAKLTATPYLAAGWRTSRGYNTTKFFVQFHPDMLPRDKEVRQVYWDKGIQENGTGYKNIALHPVNEDNGYAAQVSFTHKDIEALPGDWERRRYGLAWEWDNSKNEPTHDR